MSHRSHKRSRSHRRNSLARKTMKRLSKTASVVVPKVEASLETIGSKVSQMARASAPTIKKGLSSMYGIVKTGTLATAKTIRSTLKRRTNKRSRRSSRRSRSSRSSRR